MSRRPRRTMLTERFDVHPDQTTAWTSLIMSRNRGLMPARRRVSPSGLPTARGPSPHAVADHRTIDPAFVRASPHDRAGSPPRRGFVVRTTQHLDVCGNQGVAKTRNQPRFRGGSVTPHCPHRGQHAAASLCSSWRRSLRSSSLPTGFCHIWNAHACFRVWHDRCIEISSAGRPWRRLRLACRLVVH
jgi:hypothetical protein